MIKRSRPSCRPSFEHLPPSGPEPESPSLAGIMLVLPSWVWLAPTRCFWNPGTPSKNTKKHGRTHHRKSSLQTSVRRTSGPHRHHSIARRRPAARAQELGCAEGQLSLARCPIVFSSCPEIFPKPSYQIPLPMLCFVCWVHCQFNLFFSFPKRGFALGRVALNGWSSGLLCGLTGDLPCTSPAFVAKMDMLSPSRIERCRQQLREETSKPGLRLQTRMLRRVKR